MRMSTVKNLGLANLSERRYRILLEESWYHERPEVRTTDRIWYEIIPCRGFKPGPMQEGPFIGLYSENPLRVQLYTNRFGNAKNIWKQIKDEPGCRADFYMDGEAVLYFPPEAVHTVAELAGARKKRRLSEAHKAKLAEANRAYRFKPKFYASEDQKSA
jgi:hypothetical protein